MVLNQKIPEREIGQRAYTIMVLNQKILERKNWSQSIHYNGSKPKNTNKEKSVSEHT